MLFNKVTWDDIFGMLKKFQCESDVETFLETYFPNTINMIDDIFDEINNIDLGKHRDIIFQVIFNSEHRYSNEELWEKYFNKFNEHFPLSYLIEKLWDHDFRGCNNENEIMNFIMSKKYRCNNLDELTSEQFEELCKAFEDNDYVDIPGDVENFLRKKKFVDHLLSFKDVRYIEDNYHIIDFEINEIRDILTLVAKNQDQIPNFDLDLFCDLVKFYAPNNYLGKKYRNAFVLYVFEGYEEWTQEQFDYFSEEFYDIDFADAASDHYAYINESISQEANYISNMLKKYPNYRHD